MKVYFIRHGETLYNRRHIHQDENVALSDLGRAQIGKATVALKQIPITKLITSDYTRARESAGIISAGIGISPEENKLFREVQRPTQLYGKWHFSIETAFIGLQMMLNLPNESWHHSDEENLFDLRDRVRAAVVYLAGLKDEHEHIAVVSHSFIINLFVNYMCSHTDVRVRDYLRILLSAKRLGNASITTVMLKDDLNPHTCDWLCFDFDNRSHLKA